VDLLTKKGELFFTKIRCTLGGGTERRHRVPGKHKEGEGGWGTTGKFLCFKKKLPVVNLDRGREKKERKESTILELEWKKPQPDWSYLKKGRRERWGGDLSRVRAGKNYLKNEGGSSTAERK